MLFAFDELSGLIHAYSLMRPNGYAAMEVKGVKKRFKDKAFAASVSRDEINDAANRAGIKLSNEKNETRSTGLLEINSGSSKVKVLVIPTNEELEIV